MDICFFSSPKLQGRDVDKDAELNSNVHIRTFHILVACVWKSAPRISCGFGADMCHLHAMYLISLNVFG